MGAGAALASGLLVWWVLWRPIPFPAPQASQSAAQVTWSDFVGSEACAGCHETQFSAWRGSTHGHAGGGATPDQVIAPFDGRPIRFADAVVIPRATKDQGYTFTIQPDGSEPQVIQVAGVIGKGLMAGGGTQGFVADFPDGTVRFLAFDYSAANRTWFCNTGGRTNRGWVPITPDMLLQECADWPPSRVLGPDPRWFVTCQECHGSQIQVVAEPTQGRFTTRYKSLTINCESCHGPGRSHVERARGGRLGEGADIGMVALQTVTKDRSLETCFQCHALKTPLEPGYLPGERIAEHYSLDFPALQKAPLFPDGRVRSFAYQENHRYSDCYLNGSMTCTDCHDPHSQSYRDVWNRPLEGRYADGQCLSCHASKAEAPELHTRHPRGSAGSQCVACHMPYLQHPEVGHAGVRYGRSDHSIAIPRPAFDSILGIEGACRQCHRDRSVQDLQGITQRWWGELKPQRPLVAAMTQRFPSADAAAAALLTPGSDPTVARVAALSRFTDEFVQADVALDGAARRALEQLATDPDLDVRAAALAALHVSQGGHRPTRRMLAGALRTAGADEVGLRDRWALAVEVFGYRYLNRGDYRVAASLFARALEVKPDSPPLLVLEGAALNYAQLLDSAIIVLRRAVELDPEQHLGWLNLGLTLELQGDAIQAEQAYRRSLAVKEDEALPHFNLANIKQRTGRVEEAVQLYERALFYDPMLAPARRYLIQTYAERGELGAALRAARDGLRFAPQDQELKDVVEKIRQAGGR